MSGLSSFIKQRRHELGLTQKEFAERFRLSLRVLRSIEQGHSNVLLSSVIDIMTALGYELIPGEFAYADVKQGPARPPAVDEVIPRLRQYMPVLKKKFDVERIAVFGSVARGEQGNGSDIDILVQFTHSASLKFEAALVEYLKRILGGYQIDLISMHRLNPAFYSSIEKELLYA